jgi:hypothetical protein
VRNGYRLPDSIEAWSDFDFVGAVGGPWVSAEKFRIVERFKFYQQLGYDRPRLITRALQPLARWRCERQFFSAPLEMAIGRRFKAAPSLS